MKINMTLKMPRKIALGALAAVAALAFWPEKDRPVAAPHEPAAAQPARAREPVAHIEVPAREAMPELARDPFSVGAPKKPVRTVVASAPAIPANPYRFAGEMRVGGAVQRFLARGDDTFEAKAGDVLEDGYTVDAVNDKEIVLLHRASGMRQALAVGAPEGDAARSRVVQVAQAGHDAGVAQSAQAQRLPDALMGNLPKGFFLDAGSAPAARSRTPG
jgi:hypothetical protein